MISTRKIALIVLLSSIGVRGLYYALTDGFCPQRIETAIPFPRDMEVPPPSHATFKELQTITQQPFTYLAKGSQAYAFESSDGRFILKLFKYHHMRPAEWLLNVPCPKRCTAYRKSLVERRRHRITLAFNSYKIAATSLLNESGLSYAQILPTHQFSLPVTIQDSIGRRYTIDLALHGFAIQKKASLVAPSIENWIKNNEIEKAKKAIDSLIGIMVKRSTKGIQDSDPDPFKNAGLIDTHALFIDIGSFHKNEKIKTQQEMQRDINKLFGRFKGWLSERSPELLAHLESRLSCPWNCEWTEDVSA